MSDLPQPEVVITHESDLDGFVSGHLLQRLANHLFDLKPKLQAWNYTNFEKRPLREDCAWVCDLNFSKRMDRENWLVVDHHQTDHEPQNARLILDPLLVLELVGVEAADKTGQHSVLFTREETTAHNSVGDIHDHQLLGGLAPLPGFTGNRIRNRTQKG